MLFKSSATVSETSPFSLGRILGGTVGRATSLVTDPLIHQENFPHTLSNMTPEEADEAKEELERKYKRALSGTEVELGGPAMLHNLSRVWHNPRAGIFSKLVGTLLTPGADLLSALGRAGYYNPFSDTVVTGANSPEILRQRLGEAAYLNQLGEATAGGPTSTFGRIARNALPIGTVAGVRAAQIIKDLGGYDTALSAANRENRHHLRSTIYPATVSGLSLIGAPLGGMWGHSIGKSYNNTAATVGGTLLGGALGGLLPVLLARLAAGMVNRVDTGGRTLKHTRLLAAPSDKELDKLRARRAKQHKEKEKKKKKNSERKAA